MKMVGYWTEPAVKDSLLIVSRRSHLAAGLLLLWAGLSLPGCRNQASEPARPQWLLPEDSMVLILTDIHLVEGARSGTQILGDSLHRPSDYYKKVYEKYGLTASKYDSIFSWYSAHAPLMNQLYARMLERLNRLEARQQAQGEKTTEKGG